MCLIKLENISKNYGNKQILKDFSLEIKKGEFIAIVGKSGAGKSTLLNIIGLLEKIDSGNFLLCGERNIKPNSKLATKFLREKISYLFQNFALVEEQTVLYNLKLVQKYIKDTKENKMKDIKKALELVGLIDYEKNKIYSLSGGEQQRVAIARVLIKPSEIVLADEPTGSLDKDNAEFIIELLRKMQKQGKTIIIVTHDKELTKYCDRVIEIKS